LWRGDNESNNGNSVNSSCIKTLKQSDDDVSDRTTLITRRMWTATTPMPYDHLYAEWVQWWLRGCARKPIGMDARVVNTSSAISDPRHPHPNDGRAAAAA